MVQATQGSSRPDPELSARDHMAAAYHDATTVGPSLRAAYGYGYLAKAVTQNQPMWALCAIIEGINRAILAGVHDGAILPDPVPTDVFERHEFEPTFGDWKYCAVCDHRRGYDAHY
jgi:hypothetical protein